MKCIIAGGRNILDSDLVFSTIKQSQFDITKVLSGGAQGVDFNGEKWGEYNKVPVEVFTADWEKHGKAAGPIRNQEMVDEADALILVWDGKSRGSWDVLQKAQNAGLKIFVKTINNWNIKNGSEF